MTDADSTPDAILDAAERLFARQGYAATTVKQLGAAASVNPALLYYYFGDKAGLYQATLKRLLGEIAVTAGERLQGAAPEEAVRRLLAVQTDILLSRPHAARLLMRELVDHEAEHAAPAAAGLIQRAFEGLCSAIRAGQQAGVFRSDVRPEYAALSTVGQLVYVVLARPLFVANLGARSGLADEAGMRAFGEHAAAFALSALRP